MSICFLLLLSVGAVNAENAYVIKVIRGPSDNGKLLYKGSFELEATCYWKKDKRVEAFTDTTCGATTLKVKKRPGIFIPKFGDRGIFIHSGSSPADSDGCIVLPKEKFLKIYDDIEPKDGKNVTVIVTDEAASPTKKASEKSGS